MMVVVVIMVVRVPAVPMLDISTIPIPHPHIIAMDPTPMTPVSRHPDIMPAPVPEVAFSFIVRLVTDLD